MMKTAGVWTLVATALLVMAELGMPQKNCKSFDVYIYIYTYIHQLCVEH